MKKTIFTILSCLMLIPFASAMHHEASGHKISEAEVIKIAQSAAPANVSGDATIMSSDGTILVEGTNGWTCMPGTPPNENVNPMCVDKAWQKWLAAYMAQGRI